jgi:hypothetical protein
LEEISTEERKRINELSQKINKLEKCLMDKEFELKDLRDALKLKETQI